MVTTMRRNSSRESRAEIALQLQSLLREKSARKPTVLIVDDEPHLRLLYESELRQSGFSTLSAADGQRCLDNLLSMDIDLIVLDIRMPGMDGIDLLSRIRGQDREIPIIINTAYSSYAENYLTWTADAFVVKSADLSELVEKALQLAGRARRLDSPQRHSEAAQE